TRKRWWAAATRATATTAAAMGEIRVPSLYDSKGLRNALEDGARLAFPDGETSSSGWRVDSRLADLRLALVAAAVACAAFSFWRGLRHPFPADQPVLIACIAGGCARARAMPSDDS